MGDLARRAVLREESDLDPELRRRLRQLARPDLKVEQVALATRRWCGCRLRRAKKCRIAILMPDYPGAAAAPAMRGRPRRAVLVLAECCTT